MKDPVIRCTRCNSNIIRRTRRIGLVEGIVHRWRGKAPFRCRECGMRFSAAWTGAAVRSGSRRSLVRHIGLETPPELKIALGLALASVVAILVFVILWMLLDGSQDGLATGHFFDWLFGVGAG